MRCCIEYADDVGVGVQGKKALDSVQALGQLVYAKQEMVRTPLQDTQKALARTKAHALDLQYNSSVSH